jgi:hypothetical protein
MRADGAPDVGGDGPRTDAHGDARALDANVDGSAVGCSLCVAAGGQCSNGVCTLKENLGGLTATVQSQLQAGGSADAAFAWLYPYDGTVFPRGILPPTLQFSGTVPDAVWVHVSFSEMTYDGFFGSSNAPLGGGQAALSVPAWTALTALAGPTEPVQVSVTKMSGGNVAGPITRTWTIAPGAARGTIYYETYGSALISSSGSLGIMQIRPGATVPTVVKSGCGNVCHTASADGSTLVSNTTFPTGSASYDLKNNVATLFSATSSIFTYGGLYPDGTFAMSATNYRTWVSPNPSRLYDTRTGVNIPAPGWDSVITNAGTSSFSPDGKHIAFNHEDTGSGHTLGMMDFEVMTNTFSNLVDIATDSVGTLAWPAWTPDSASVVFHSGSNAQFETDGASTSGDVFVVDVASQTKVRLDALDGYDASGVTYLPGNDPGLSFAPTVLPEAVGGYFWVVFTSHRSYGNTLASNASDGMTPNDRGKLWVAAIDIGGTPGQDRSHPAFFLQGQELVSDNLRGFWVLDPCELLGSACSGGDQCCAGFCSVVSGSPQCAPPPAMGCSNELEACVFATDCCNPSDECINGHCALRLP